MYGTTSTCGQIHRSGAAVAEWGWWKLSPCFWTRVNKRGREEGYIRGLAADEPLQDLYIATEQQWCRQGSATRPPNEAATRAPLPINPNRGGELYFPGCSVLTRLRFTRELLLADARSYYQRPETSGGIRAAHVWWALLDEDVSAGWWRRSWILWKTSSGGINSLISAPGGRLFFRPPGCARVPGSSCSEGMSWWLPDVRQLPLSCCW